MTCPIHPLVVLLHFQGGGGWERRGETHSLPIPLLVLFHQQFQVLKMGFHCRFPNPFSGI